MKRKIVTRQIILKVLLFDNNNIMSENISRRSFLGKTAAAAGSATTLAGCNSFADDANLEDPSSTTANSTETEPSSTEDKIQEDTGIGDDLERLEFKLENKGFEPATGEEGLLTYNHYNDRIFARVQVEDVIDVEDLHMQYLGDADAVDSFMEDAAYRFGVFIQTTMDELHNNSFTSLSLTAYDRHGAGHGIQFESDEANELYSEMSGRPDETLQDLMEETVKTTAQEPGISNVISSSANINDGVYLEEGQTKTFATGDAEHTVEAIKTQIYDAVVKINGELLELEDDEIVSVDGYEFAARTDPLERYGNGVAIESLNS